jgi:hypothetical protein
MRSWVESPLEEFVTAASQAHSPFVSVAGAMLVGTAALMILGIQPILLGALTEEHRLSIAELGRLATVENLALAASSAVGVATMGGARLRTKAAAACAALALVNLGQCFATGGLLLFVLRGVAGALEGLMLGGAICILTATPNPDRINGLFLAVQTIPQMIAAYLLPVALIPRWGSDSGFALLSAMALVALAGAAALRAPPPTQARAAAETNVQRARATLPTIIALIAVVVQNAGIGGAWNYVEQVGSLHAFGADIIGVALSASLAAQVAGAFFVAWIGWRAPYRIVLAVGIGAQALIVLVLARLSSSPVFVAAATGFGLLWLGLQPYQIRQLIGLDPSRRAVLLVLPLALTGLSLGPFAVSFAARPDGVGGCF